MVWLDSPGSAGKRAASRHPFVTRSRWNIDLPFVKPDRFNVLLFALGACYLLFVAHVACRSDKWYELFNGDQSMREKAENLGTYRRKQGPDKKPGASQGSAKVCVFPTQIDTDTQMAKAIAKKLGIPFVDPLRAHIEPSAVAFLKPEIAFNRQALPIRLVNNILLVAMAAPQQSMAIRSLEILTSCKIRPAVAPKSSLSIALRQAYGQPSRGASQGQAQAALKGAKDKRAGARETGARTISVVSNKGGVGKTHFSINLASALAKASAKVLLIDADLGNADISTKLGVFSKHHLLHFLQKNQDMKDIIIPTTFHFDLICGTYGEFKLANLYLSLIHI